MANSLLDFVMSLVRDPDAAARYAADPAGAIADAHLMDVTSADVNNLIPMVADSLSMAAPAIRGGQVTDGNVWASGAATAAFDAFEAHLPAIAPETYGVIAGVIDQPAEAAHSAVRDAGIDPGAAGLEPVETTYQVTDYQPGGEAPADWADAGGFEHSHVDDSHPSGNHLGFDIF